MKPGEAALVAIQVSFRLVEGNKCGIVEEEILSGLARQGHRGPSSNRIQTSPPSTSLEPRHKQPVHASADTKNQFFPRVENLSAKSPIVEYHP